MLGFREKVNNYASIWKISPFFEGSLFFEFIIEVGSFTLISICTCRGEIMKGLIKKFEIFQMLIFCGGMVVLLSTLIYLLFVT